MFADLNICLSDDQAKNDRIVSTLDQLGYDSAAFTISIEGKLVGNDLAKKAEKATAFKTAGRGLRPRRFTRINIALKDQSQVFGLKENSAFLKAFDIVSVTPETDKLFQHCCGLDVVDVISFDLAVRLPFFIKRPQVSQAISKGIYFEICYGTALKDNMARRYLVSNAQQIVQATQGRNIIISSGAEEALDLRGPYDIVTLATLFSLSQTDAKPTISTNMHSVLMRAATRRDAYRAAVAISSTKLPGELQSRAHGLAQKGGTEPEAMEV